MDSSPIAVGSNIRISSSLVTFPTYLHNLTFEAASADEYDELLKRRLKSLKPPPPPPPDVIIKAQETAAVVETKAGLEQPPPRNISEAAVPLRKDHLNHLKIRRQSLSYRRAMLSTARYRY